MELCLHLLALAHHCLCFLVQSSVVGHDLQPAIFSEEH
jgi:hypothetical protein